MAVGVGNCMEREKSHILTLSFDDGFKKSFYKVADIHEEFGLSACLNVIASGHLPDFQLSRLYHTVKRGDLGNFDDWNALQKRGHEIMPHTWAHKNLTKMPLSEAQKLITKCLAYFEDHLIGFDASKAVYNFAFNASTPELENFALTQVKAVRTGGWNWKILENPPTNLMPGANGPRKLGCWSFGPDNADEWLKQQVNEFLAGYGGWLVLNLHGLDGEGWGSISSAYLTALLKRLVKIDFLEILPAGEVIKRVTI